MKLSILIPCYNEKVTLPVLLDKIEQVDLSEVKKEIILIDDCSTDGTREFLQKLDPAKYRVLFQNSNQGKGAAIRAGLKVLTGDLVIIQDADLEYDPQDYKQLLQPLLSGKAQVVYGSRERNQQNKKHSGVLFYLGGLFLTWFTNRLYGSHLSDEATCYKVFEKNLLLSIPLESQRFEFCPEVTAKILKRGITIHEVPISYYPRKVSEGKKIRFRDGLQALWVLLKYRFKE